MKSFIKKYLRLLLVMIVPCLFIMASCEEDLIGTEQVNTPVNNFEYFWKTLDTHYGLFEVKQIDWNQLYSEYRPQVNDQMTDDELYNVLTSLIIQLNDNHVNLYPTNGALPVFPGGVIRYEDGELTILKVQEDYALDVVKNYVPALKQATEFIRYGTIDNTIGYLNIKGTDSQKDTQRALEKILGEFQLTQGLIIDLRGHYGGIDAVSQLVAGYFSSETKLYMTSRKRNGPNHSDFTSVNEWYLRPGYPSYGKPVYVLTSRFTQSAGETLTLALKELSHITFIGDTTAGGLSDNPNFELPNGWIFSVSVGDYRAADGTSYEGKGIPPDQYVRTSKEDLLAGKDPALEQAIALAKQ
jgi:carboxyl-terminal processing protease